MAASCGVTHKSKPDGADKKAYLAKATCLIVKRTTISFGFRSILSFMYEACHVKGGRLDLSMYTFTLVRRY